MSASSPIRIDDDSPLSSSDTSSVISNHNRKLIVIPRLNDKRVPLKRKVFVSVPRISSERKLLYKPLNKSFLGIETRVDEVIGEYHEDDTLYYFARYDGGIARKVRVLKVNILDSQGLTATSPVLCLDIRS